MMFLIFSYLLSINLLICSQIYSGGFYFDFVFKDVAPGLTQVLKTTYVWVKSDCKFFRPVLSETIVFGLILNHL